MIRTKVSVITYHESISYDHVSGVRVDYPPYHGPGYRTLTFTKQTGRVVEVHLGLNDTVRVDTFDTEE